jgi:Holliday junction resolvase
VVKFLESEGCWVVKFFANAYTKRGIPDLLVCCNGYFLGVELKAPNGKPSELQLWNIKKIKEAGGIALVLYPKDFDDFKQLILNLKEGEELCK